MPRPTGTELRPLDPADALKIPGFKRVTKHSAKFPRQAVSAPNFDNERVRGLERQADSAKMPAQPRLKRINAVAPSTENISKLRAIHESDHPTGEITARGLGPEQTLGVLYSSLILLEYSDLKQEYKKRRRTDRGRADREWSEISEAAVAAFRNAGMNVTVQELDRYASQFTAGRANLRAVREIAKSAEETEVVGPGAVAAALGNFVTVGGVFIDPSQIVTVAPDDLCDRPIEGKYTKHFSYSFSLTVRLTVWCPTWTNPFKTCKKNFTVAGASFSLDLEVGYRITCCGATAYGQAVAQACVTVLGVKVCAACSAKVTGVAGIAKEGSGSSCSFGLGVVAELKCTLAGITVFYAAVPYGWTVTGPCPPDSLPC